MSRDLPIDFGKMPPNYSFSHKGNTIPNIYIGIKWDEYKNDYSLRTDAVWEKQ